MKDALELYRRLGFDRAAATYLTVSTCPGHPPRPMGAANTRIEFNCNLIELVTIVSDESSFPPEADMVQVDVAPKTEMLRAGVGFAAVMRLLGHSDPGMTMRYVDFTLTISSGSFNWLARNLAIWSRSPKPHRLLCVQATTASSTPCSLLRTSCWCFAPPSQTATPALNSTSSLTGSPRSSPKHANFKSTE